MPLIDYYGKFAVCSIACSICGWTGIGEEAKTGDSFGDGVEKHCPMCWNYFGFVQFSVFVVDDSPQGREANIGRVEYLKRPTHSPPVAPIVGVPATPRYPPGLWR